METKRSDKHSYISTYKCMVGWKAIHIWFNVDDGGFWEPWVTSDFAFATESEAINYAKTWARKCELIYIPCETEK